MDEFHMSTSPCHGEPRYPVKHYSQCVSEGVLEEDEHLNQWTE